MIGGLIRHRPCHEKGVDTPPHIAYIKPYTDGNEPKDIEMKSSLNTKISTLPIGSEFVSCSGNRYRIFMKNYFYVEAINLDNGEMDCFANSAYVIKI